MLIPVLGQVLFQNKKSISISVTMSFYQELAITELRQSNEAAKNTFVARLKVSIWPYMSLSVQIV